LTVAEFAFSFVSFSSAKQRFQKESSMRFGAHTQLVAMLMISGPICCCATGCSGRAKGAPTLYRVGGTVTYKGQAVPGAKVMFMGDGNSPPAVGVTDADGRYQLSSLSGTGAVAGKHAVVVLKETEPDPAAKVNMTMEEAAEAAKKPVKPQTATSIIPSKYASPQTSGLEFEVKAGSNDIPIELK
jgi:hypothetical protein